MINRKIISSWLIDQRFNRLLGGSGLLLGGDLLATLLRMVTIALTARALGLDSFGVLVVIQTFVGIVDRVVNFQSWQALIKFGADKVSTSSKRELEDLFQFGLCVDASTAILGSIIAVCFAPIVGEWLGWSDSVTSLAMIYSIVIAFNIEGVAVAALRLFGRFDLLGMHKVVAALPKLLATVVAFFTTKSLLAFLIIAAIGQIIGSVILLAFAFRQLTSENLYPLKNGQFTRAYRENSEILTYLVTTNFHGTFRMLPDLVDVIIVNSVLGNSSTALYKVVKEFGGGLKRLIQPLYQTIYPELARLAASNDFKSFLLLVGRSSVFASLIAIGFWITFYAFGNSIITVAFGAEFSEASSVLLIYSLGLVIAAITFPITPALLALGAPKVPLFGIIVGSMVYISVLPIALRVFGLDGAGYAFILFYAVWVVVMGATIPGFLKSKGLIVFRT